MGFGNSPLPHPHQINLKKKNCGKKGINADYKHFLPTLLNTDIMFDCLQQILLL